MNVMIRWMINIEKRWKDLWFWKRFDRILRLESNPDGRDVIKLEWRECDEGNDKWMMKIECVLNDEWLWKRYFRPLRPENTPGVRDVIELEFRLRDEWIDKWMINIELYWMMSDYDRGILDYWDQ